MFKRIVQRKGDGKYAVKRYTLFIGWEYRGIDDSNIWWSSDEYIDKYCWTDDYNKALELLEFDDEEVIKRK